MCHFCVRHFGRVYISPYNLARAVALLGSLG
jgi:hypothetical protein